MVMRLRVEQLFDTFSDAIVLTQRQIRESDERQREVIARVVEENRQQTRRLDVLKSGHDINEAWRQRIDMKIDDLILRQSAGETRSRAWSRRYLLLLVATAAITAAMFGFVLWRLG